MLTAHPNVPPNREDDDDDAGAAAACAPGAPDAADAARLGRYMRAWWSVAGGVVGAALRPSAYAAPPNDAAATADPAQPLAV